MPNVFGRVDEEGLTNPLNEDLLADGFNALDFNEVHLNELHDNSGTGKIVVHEDLNMTNNYITNLADPVAGKDAVNLDYAESNFASQASVPDEAPYDVYGAFTDETSAITIGLAPMVLPASRNFTLTNIRAFLTTPAGFPNYTIAAFVLNGLPLTTPTCSFSGSSDTTSNLITLATPLSISQGDRFEVNCNPGGSAAGLKVVFMGNVPI